MDFSNYVDIGTLSDEEYQEYYDTLLSLVDELFKDNDEEIEEFRKNSILTKDQLLSSISETIDHYQKEANSGSEKHAPVYYSTINQILKKFRYQVENLTLPEPLHTWWFYSYEISDTGIRLFLNYLDWEADLQSTEIKCRINSSFTLVEVQADLMTVNDYAKRYDIQPVTVRQWIRRGKIRSAIKFGGEWRIPELFELNKVRGYTPSIYVWSSTLTDVPEKFAFLNDFVSARFSQDLKDKKIYTVEFSSADYGSTSIVYKEDIEDFKILFDQAGFNLVFEDNGDYYDVTIQMSRETREELELFMMSNPLVANKTLLHFDDRSVHIGLDYTGYDGFEIDASQFLSDE